MKKLTTPAKVCLQAVLILLLATATLSANDGRISVEDYIAQYKFVAIEEMRNAGIPASITLAQAILESRYGNSELAKTANNHFGIKCHDWKGESVYRDDDVANECFRKYRSSYESFLDHSRFLERTRYAELFTYATSDYQSWAKGLQKAGYATDPNYAKRLVDLIEKYELFRYDEPINQGTTVVVQNNPVSPVESTRQFQASVGTENVAQYAQPVTYNKPADKSNYTSSKRVKRTTPFYYNKIKTVVLEAPATAKQVAVIYNIDKQKICRYNDVQPNEVIPANTKVYLQPKRNKGANSQIMHTVKDGQTMERISQYYGIKLRKLYKRNMMQLGTQPAKGQVIYLRGKAGFAPVLADNNNYVAPVQQQPVQKNKIVIANNGSANNQYKSYTSTTTKPVQNNNTQQGGYDYYSSKSTADPTKNTDSGYKSYQKSTNTVTTQTVDTTPKANDKVEVYYGSKEPKTTTTTTSNNQTSTVKSYQQIKTTSPYSGSISTVSTTKPTNNTNYYASTSNNYEPTTPNYSTSVASPKKQKKQHVVVKGDTLYNISKRYNTTVDEIKALNNLGGNTIKLGQNLAVITNTK